MVDNFPILGDFDADYRALHPGWAWFTVEECEKVAPLFEALWEKLAPVMDGIMDQYQQGAVVDGEILR